MQMELGTSTNYKTSSNLISKMSFCKNKQPKSAAAKRLVLILALFCALSSYHFCSEFPHHNKSLDMEKSAAIVDAESASNNSQQIEIDNSAAPVAAPVSTPKQLVDSLAHASSVLQASLDGDPDVTPQQNDVGHWWQRMRHHQRTGSPPRPVSTGCEADCATSLSPLTYFGKHSYLPDGRMPDSDSPNFERVCGGICSSLSNRSAIAMSSVEATIGGKSEDVAAFMDSAFKAMAKVYVNSHFTVAVDYPGYADFVDVLRPGCGGEWQGNSSNRPPPM